ncbi:MAG TPA: hypothetical protein PKA58_12645 [Polyangium sp.]|nr:hypothetical protein [Polyangium sp.]
MHTRNFIWGFGLALGSLALTGCGSESTNQPPPGPATVDEFAVIPAVPDGAVQYDFPEQIVQPGADVQTCYFLDPVKEDTFIKALDSYQGRFGHHLILFRSEKPEPVGLVRDCTSVQDMVNLLPVISSINFGLQEFPAGMAIRVPAGTQLVLQQHIVNTSENAIRLHDAVHVRTVPQAEVQILAGFYGLSDLDFVLPPHKEYTSNWECQAPRDMNLLMIGPHMHEWGKSFVAQVGPADNLQTVIDIPEWRAEMRDKAPVTHYSKDAPLPLKQGDLIRTKCVWNNTEAESLIFPYEMCATFGYYFPAPEGSEVWTCGGSQVF